MRGNKAVLIPLAFKYNKASLAPKPMFQCESDTMLPSRAASPESEGVVFNSVAKSNITPFNGDSVLYSNVDLAKAS